MNARSLLERSRNRTLTCVNGSRTFTKRRFDRLAPLAMPVRAGAAPEADAVRAGDDGVSEVERLRAEVASLKGRALRAQAEVENFKKRSARDKADTARYANEDLLRGLLPVIDNLQRAVDH